MKKACLFIGAIMFYAIAFSQATNRTEVDSTSSGYQSKIEKQLTTPPVPPVPPIPPLPPIPPTAPVQKMAKPPAPPAPPSIRQIAPPPPPPPPPPIPLQPNLKQLDDL